MLYMKYVMGALIYRSMPNIYLFWEIREVCLEYVKSRFIQLAVELKTLPFVNFSQFPEIAIPFFHSFAVNKLEWI